MKLYAVAKGNKTGIFNSWEECQEATKGYSDAKFIKCNSFEEAELYIRKFSENKSCKYCNTITKLHSDVLGGADMSDTDGGTLRIEKVNGFYYLASVCFDGDATESEPIYFCPKCGNAFPNN